MPERLSALMLFDGVCNFCSGGVLFIIQRTPDADVQFCAMQTETGQKLLASLNLPTDNYESVAVITKDETLLKSDAIVELGQRMTVPWPWMANLLGALPKPLRDWLYDRVARNRYGIMGRKTECMIPPPEIRERFV